MRDSTDVVDGKAGNDRQQEINSKRKSGKFLWCFVPQFFAVWVNVSEYVQERMMGVAACLLKRCVVAKRPRRFVVVF